MLALQIDWVFKKLDVPRDAMNPCLYNCDLSLVPCPLNEIMEVPTFSAEGGDGQWAATIDPRPISTVRLIRERGR